MGAGKSGLYSNTRGSRQIYSGQTKSDALASVRTLPETVQKTAKSFFKGSSNNYNKYSVQKNSDGGYTIKMENPGKVPGSKAVYYKVVDKDGRTVRVYKETFDPDGKLVHVKEK